MSESLTKEVENKIKILEEEADKIAQWEKIKFNNLESLVENEKQEKSKRKRLLRGTSIIETSVELKEIEEEIMNVENNIRNEKENTRRAKKKNNEEFFQPLKASIANTKKAIEMVETYPEDAKMQFIKILETWPNNTDYILNLAKFLYEHNEIFGAIDHLIYFLENSSEYNYYHILIKEFLNFDMKEYRGSNKDVKFFVENNEIFVEEILSNNELQLPFNYRIPIDLEIQRYDKLPIQGYLDSKEYQLLIQNNSKGESIKTLEICLPINSMSNFINNFVGDLKDKYELYNYLINLDQIYLLKFLNENKIEALKGERNYEDDAIYTVQELENEMNFIVPFVVIDIKEVQLEIFLEDFKRFILKYVMPQLNLRHLLNAKKIEYKEEERNIEYQLSMENKMFESWTEEFIKEKEVSFINTNVVPYATLVVMLSNLKNKIDPHFTPNKSIYREAFNSYLDKFDGRYKEYKIIEEEGLENIEGTKELKVLSEQFEILELISNKDRKKEIEKEWNIVITNYKDKDNVKSMVAMRKTLEILSYAHYLKVGNLVPRNIDLRTQYARLYRYINDEEIATKIDKIRKYANQKVHYYRPDERKFTDLVKVSRNEIYNDFKDVLSYYVKEIGI